MSYATKYGIDEYEWLYMKRETLERIKEYVSEGKYEDALKIMEQVLDRDTHKKCHRRLQAAKEVYDDEKCDETAQELKAAKEALL